MLHSEKLNMYHKQLEEYEPEVRDWAVSMYDEYGKQIHKHIGNMVKENSYSFFIILTANLEVSHMNVTLNLLKSFSTFLKQAIMKLIPIYRKMPKKPFIKGRKQEFEVLFMYCWLHDLEGDNDYKQEYLEKVLPDFIRE